MESQWTSELQMLVCSDGDGENDDSTIQDETLNETKPTSPVRSCRISSSGNTSHSSVVHHPPLRAKMSFIIEQWKNKKLYEINTARLRNAQKDSNDTSIQHHSFIPEVPDLRRMERALLRLLAHFHSGKLTVTMEQKTCMREQEEKLAKIDFGLSLPTDPSSLSDDNLRREYNTMNQLIQRLEHLSVSIEALHNNTNK